jgi:Na+-transporting methylmalonyl-CoA/oxaloacetate decarboxylase gamma subunit
MDVSVPEALGYSVLGLAVVFIVLIFLMFIVWLMSLILKPKAGVTAAGSGIGGAGVPEDVGKQAVLEIAASAVVVTGTTAASAVDATAGTASVETEAADEIAGMSADGGRHASMAAMNGRFRVVISGIDHIVDAAEADRAYQVKGGGK